MNKMRLQDRRVILYIAMSLDGFIAGNDDNLDFLNLVQEENEDYGYYSFLDSIDTILIGRKTYEKVVDMVGSYPNKDKKTYVLSRTQNKTNDTVEFYSGDLTELIHGIRSKPGKHIYCDGGAEIINALLEKDLIDEMILSIVPTLLGSGVRLFSHPPTNRGLHLISTQSYKRGLVQLHYEFK